MALRLAIRAELQPWTEYFEGSVSIKYVLESLVPESSYNDLVIVVTPEAVAHYVDFERGVVHLDRRPSAELLRRNVRGLAAFMVMCAADGATLLAHVGFDSGEQMDRLSSVRDELVSNHQARKV